jgi:hypothetical protein
MWRNLEKFVALSDSALKDSKDNKSKQILFGVSGTAKASEMVALMVISTSLTLF